MTLEKDGLTDKDRMKRLSDNRGKSLRVNGLNTNIWVCTMTSLLEGLIG